MQIGEEVEVAEEEKALEVTIEEETLEVIGEMIPTGKEIHH